MSGPTVAELLERHQRAAANRLPASVVEFIATGAGEGISAGEAAAAWRRFRLRPHVLRDVSVVDTSTDLLGLRLRAPIMVAPMAYQGLAHASGEREAAYGVRDADLVMVAPTRSSVALGAVAEVLGSEWWFQLYCLRDRQLTLRIATAAAGLGARALVLTGDAPFLGRKPSGPVPAEAELQHTLVLGDFIDPDVPSPEGAVQDPSIDLSMIATLIAATGLPVIVKGVLRGDDAVACVDAGAAGVVVSNHGGRQLDRAVASAAVLAEVVDAVAARCPVLVDGGLRGGIDVLVALSLGASAVLVGRPVLWALAGGGAAAVSELLHALVRELAEAMALAGVRRICEVDRSLIA